MFAGLIKSYINGHDASILMNKCSFMHRYSCRGTRLRLVPPTRISVHKLEYYSVKLTCDKNKCKVCGVYTSTYIFFHIFTKGNKLRVVLFASLDDVAH